MKGNWATYEMVRFGAVLEEIDKLDFDSPRAVSELLHALSTKYSEPYMAMRVASALTRASSQSAFLREIEDLMDQSIKHLYGEQSGELMGIWLLTLTTMFPPGRAPDANFMAFFDLTSVMFARIHSWHNQGGKESFRAITDLELALLNAMDLIKPVWGIAGRRYLLPDANRQSDILNWLLQLEKDFATSLIHREDDPVRRKIQELVIALVRAYDEDLVFAFYSDLSWGDAVRELLERGLTKRFGRGDLIASYLTHLRCSTAT
jgi:hypothetical protein